MKERPILFNTDMVRAILEGRKTETRRIVKFKDLPLEPLHHNIWKSQSGWQDGDMKIKCPYGQVGNRLWVRETYHFVAENYQIEEYKKGLVCKNDLSLIYRTDLPNHKIIDGGWTPSIFMPHWASRITLEITEIKVERVQDITEEGARAEGIIYENIHDAVHNLKNPIPYSPWVGGFAQLWNSINKKRGFSWESNPWVWVVKFKIINNGR